MARTSIHSLIKKYGIAPRKRLGQHFLSAMPTMEKIVASLEIEEGEDIVEIGPGLGVMTQLVAEHAHRVFAVETDEELLNIAREELAGVFNISWIKGDILGETIPSIVGRSKRKIAVIGNLPYNISSPIIFWMLDNREMISRALIMAQKEVAVRLSTGPGGKEYGILSVLLQACADCKRLFDVSPSSFIPAPRVSSSIVRIVFKENVRLACGEGWFKAVVKGAFGKRRKTLRNAILGAHALKIDPAPLDAALLECGIDGRRRPETLSVAEFAALASRLE
ncbi:MAG: 16S rRNA (adenine(1518)-N(6)/adenine(1519)-N(6))-dimethyltransferase RsmA [Pseudomonadota bacterium]